MFLKILKTTEQKDGTLLLDIEYDKEFESFICNHYKKKKFTKKLLKNFIIEGLTNYIKKEEK